MDLKKDLDIKSVELKKDLEKFRLEKEAYINYQRFEKIKSSAINLG
jgi:hypothetical protein